MIMMEEGEGNYLEENTFEPDKFNSIIDYVWDGVKRKGRSEVRINLSKKPVSSQPAQLLMKLTEKLNIYDIELIRKFENEKYHYIVKIPNSTE